MDEEKKQSKRTRILVGVAVAALLALGVFYARVRKVTLPDQLVGTYHTDEAKHAAHPFEISYSTVNFATDEGSVSTGFIKDVRTSVEEGKTLYTIFYTADGVDQQISFYYEATGNGAIRFKGQDQIVWKKDASS